MATQTFLIFTPIWGTWSNLTNIFQMGGNHQPEKNWARINPRDPGSPNVRGLGCTITEKQWDFSFHETILTGSHWIPREGFQGWCFETCHFFVGCFWVWKIYMSLFDMLHMFFEMDWNNGTDWDAASNGLFTDGLKESSVFYLPNDIFFWRSKRLLKFFFRGHVFGVSPVQIFWLKVKKKLSDNLT